jgi:hypothetical protein
VESGDVVLLRAEKVGNLPPHCHLNRMERDGKLLGIVCVTDKIKN